jgi:hypothetical protein
MQPFNDEPYPQMNWGRGDIMNKTRNFKKRERGIFGEELFERGIAIPH